MAEEGTTTQENQLTPQQAAVYGEGAQMNAAPPPAPVEETEEIPIGKPVKSAQLQEIDRLRTQSRETAQQLQAQAEQIAMLTGAMAVKQPTPATTLEGKLQQYSQDQLDREEVEWDRREIEATANGDTAKVNQARGILRAIRKQGQNLSTQTAQQQAAQVANFGRVQAEFQKLRNDVIAAHPELNDQTSELWQAAQREYKAAGHFAAWAGDDLASLSAVAAALAKNPHLAANKTKSRKATQSIKQALEADDESTIPTGAGDAPVTGPKGYRFTDSRNHARMQAALERGDFSVLHE
jgi:hypothetical protein